METTKVFKRQTEEEKLERKISKRWEETKKRGRGRKFQE